MAEPITWRDATGNEDASWDETVTRIGGMSVVIGPNGGKPIPAAYVGNVLSSLGEVLTATSAELGASLVWTIGAMGFDDDGTIRVCLVGR